ncbi:unnamed protein product [Prorocentrum cordatum]|uniref:Ankyrin repeat domain-containing protein n=1 Tax=Prorocentrum cordatum TaxID=2364126 RepID=A0ABN9PAL7_9DINO|nr:unnamed protein product [Polarella glacialis]|mmetsp:Transcript_55441/g.144170  ORF Transcript_55441/g.144170 Transcript_55441/m.144170 type:complete len:229 (-) Transcript_55441:107-793(-)
MEIELLPGSDAAEAGAQKSAKDSAMEARVGMPQPRGLPRGKLRFRASTVYQEVLEDHLLPAGLEIQMDVETGRNKARLCPGQVVDYVGATDNYPMVAAALRQAATANKPDLVRALVATCFYDSAAMSSALLEASAKGYADVVDVLLVGGMAKANPVAIDATEGHSALHRAMTNGHEDICKKMIDGLPSADLARPKNKQGLDPFEAAREEDLGMVAKRLEKHLAERFKD